MKLIYKKGSTSVSILIFIQDSASTTGAGKTGLAFNTSSLTGYYVRPGANATAITLATLTVTGAFSSGGFVEVDATNMPGVYRLDVPNTVLATGVNSSVVMLKGAAGMAPVLLEFQLVNFDPTDDTNLGLSGLAAVVLATGQLFIKKNTALNNFEFLMLDSSDHLSAKTGLTVTATRSIDGGAFASCANSATEVSNGIYKINFANTDLNGTIITFRFTGTGADDRFVTVITQP